MFYVKNVPNWERVLGIAAGGAAIVIGLTVLGGRRQAPAAPRPPDGA